MLFVEASLTGPLVQLATDLIGSIGLAGVALLTATSGVIGLPGTEPTMLFAGFNVYDHHLTMLGIVIFGVIGDLLGASIAYAIGFYGSHEVLERYGARLHINQASLDRSHRWFERWGPPVIVISRVIPFVRAAFPYAAGVARMGYLKFVLFAAIGSLVWIGGLGLLGRAVGSNWQSWRHHLEYVDYAAVAILLALIVFWFLRRRRSATAALAGRR